MKLPKGLRKRTNYYKAKNKSDAIKMLKLQHLKYSKYYNVNTIQKATKKKKGVYVAVRKDYRLQR